MKTVRIALMSLVALAATTPAFAADMRHPVRSDLAAAQQRLAWQAQNSKGTHAQELSAEQRRLDALIDDLEQGRPVNPADVDRALERAERGSF